MTHRSPVTDDVAVELRRVVQRWHQLPLDRALSHAPAVRELVQQLADATATAQGREPVGVPDLGPAAITDQLTVMTYDACAAGLAGDFDLATRLAGVRRLLA